MILKKIPITTLLILFFTCVTQLFGQSYFLGTSNDYSSSFYATPGLKGKSIYSFYQYHSAIVSTVTKICFTTGGDYKDTDLQPNSFRLLISNNSSIDNRSLTIGVTSISGPTSITGTYNVCFGEFTVPGNNYNYYFLTTDISSTAGHNTSIRVIERPLFSIAGASLSSNNTSNGNSLMYVKTFTSSNIYNWSNETSSFRTAGSKVKLASFYASRSNPLNHNFVGMALSISGTLTSSEIDRIELENYNSYTGSRIIVSSIAGPVLNSMIQLPSLNNSIALGDWYYTYYELFAYLNTSAGVGGTISASRIVGNDISATGANFIGTLTGLPVFTVAKGAATLSGVSMTSKSISMGSNETIYRFIVKTGQAKLPFNNIAFTVGGINLNSCVNNYYLYYNISGIDNLNSFNWVSNAYPSVYTSNTQTINFINSNFLLESNTTYYFYLTANTNDANAAQGSNISVNKINYDNIFANTSIAGILNAGITHSFINPIGTVSKVLNSTTKIGIDNYASIYIAKLEPTLGNPKVNFTLTLSGTHTTSNDISHIEIYGSKDPVIDWNSATYLSYVYSQNSDKKIWRSYDFIANGSTYLHFIAYTKSGATSGKTIRMEALVATAVTGTINNNNLSSGNTITITIPSVNVTAYNSKISTAIAPNNSRSIYTAKINISDADVKLNSISVKLGGTYNASFSYLYSYLSEYDEFNPNLSNTIANANGSYLPVSGNIDTHNFGNRVLQQGKTYYIHFVVSPYTSQIHLGKTVFIESITGISLNLSNSTMSSSVGPVVTINSTLTVENNNSALYKNFAPGQSKVLLQSFNLTTDYANYVKGIKFQIETNLLPSEVSSFELRIANQAFDQTDKDTYNIGTYSTSGLTTITSVSFTGTYLTYTNNEPYSYFLYANINTTTSGKTIRTSLVPDSENITFPGLIKSKTNPLLGGLVTMQTPVVNVRNIDVPASGITPNYGYAVYKLALTSSATTKLSSLVFSVSGTYTNADITNVYITESRYLTKNYQNYQYASVTKSSNINGGELVTFLPSNGYNLTGDTLYIDFNIQVSSGATLGRDFKLSLVSVVGINTGNLTNNTSEGQKFVISYPVVNYSFIPVDGKKINNYSFVRLGSLKIEVNGGTAVISAPGISYRMTGNYNPSNMYYVYAKMTNNEVPTYYDNASLAQVYNYYPTTTTTGTFLNSYQLSSGIYYIHYYAFNYNLSPGSTFGISVGGLNINIGTISGAGGIGNLFTISALNFTAKSIPLNQKKALIGSNNAVIAKFISTVSGGDLFIYGPSSYRTQGTYQTDDIKSGGFKVWASASATFDPATSTLIGKMTSTNKSFGAMEYISSEYSYEALKEGINYIYYTVDISNTATANRKVGITGISSSNLLYIQSSNMTFNYEDLPTEVITLVNVSPQTINVPVLNSVISVTSVPTTIPFSASATSGLPLSVSSSGVGNFTNGQLVITALGTGTLIFNQAGDPFFTPAPQVTINYSVVSVSGITNIKEASGSTKVSLSPNPATNYVEIKTEDNLISAEIYDLIGNRLIDSNNKVISIKELSKGMYITVITTNRGKSVKKLIVE